MKRLISNIIHLTTNLIGYLLSLITNKHWVETYKPIHLCWWFVKNNFSVPKYFIAGMPEPPVVSTTTATNITSNSATAGGNVTSSVNSTVTERGIAYMEGSTGNPTTANMTVADSSGGLGTFSVNLTSLNASTSYRYAAYAINRVGTAYGTTIQFTTTGGATSIQQIKRWNGSAWQPHFMKRYIGTEWVTPVIKVWTGTEWKIVQQS